MLGVRSIPVGNKTILIDNFINLPPYKLRIANGYPRIWLTGERGSVHLHSLLLPKKAGYDVDHINRNPLDNRLTNLRYATRAQNIVNSKLRKDNTTGCKGVTRCPLTNKYRARISIEGRRICLGSYHTLAEASSAYQTEAKKYYKSFYYEGDKK